MRVCKQCNEIYQEIHLFCSICGEKTEPVTKKSYCPNCNVQFEKLLNFCPFCGTLAEMTNEVKVENV